MGDPGTLSLIEALPKAELHMHVEGSLEPEHMAELARRNGVSLAFGSVEEIRAAYNFGNLQDFLDLYYQGMSVLLTARDFEDLAMAYFKRCADQNVVYTEIFFDPQGHTDRGLSLEPVMAGLTGAIARARAELDVEVGLIPNFLRHLDEDSALRTYDEMVRYSDQILGFGLDSSELGHPPSKFARVFARAKADGFKLVAHAGEEGPPEYVWDSLDVLGVDRIDHGNRSLEDPALVKRLVADDMALTVCPLSNLRLCGVDAMENHPLRAMLDAGLTVTLNSDDPAYFGGYLMENFTAIDQALEVSRDEMVAIARNGFAASFLSDKAKAERLAAFDATL